MAKHRSRLLMILLLLGAANLPGFIGGLGFYRWGKFNQGYPQVCVFVRVLRSSEIMRNVNEFGT